MTKLRGTILASTAIAFLSTFFLYASFVRSAVAQEPEVGAATTEHVEEFVELLVYENDFQERDVTIPTQEVAEVSGEDKKVIDESIKSQKELDETMSDASLALDPSFEPELSPAIEIPERKVFEVIKEEINSVVMTDLEILNLIEAEIHARSNKARMKRSEDELGFDTRLSALARERSKDMLERNYFSHTAPDGCGITCNFRTSGYDTLVWGENIARYEPFDKHTQTVVAEIFVEKWLKSSGHRDNLLSREYTHEGVGAAVLDGEIVVTVLFAAPTQ